MMNFKKLERAKCWIISYLIDDEKEGIIQQRQ